MTKPLNILVVGSGPMGRHHADAVRRIDPELAVLAGFVDPLESAAKEAGDARSVPAFVDLGDALAALNPNVVHVCAPPRFHATAAIESLQAGAHVYVEKPFTETLVEAEEVMSCAEELGLQVAAGHQLLRDPASTLGDEYLPYLGEIRHVDSYFSFKPRREASGRRPRTAIEQLLDILPHPTYLLAHFLEQGTGTPPTITSVDAGEEGWAHLTARCRYATGSLVVTLEGRPVDSFVRLVGTKGSVHLDYVRGIALATLGSGSTIEKIFDPYQRSLGLAWGSTKSLGRRFLRRERSYPGLRPMFEEFYRSILGEMDAPVTKGNILFAVAVGEQVQARIEATQKPYEAPDAAPTVAVTGGTGFLGREVVQELLVQGEVPLVLARRLPPEAERIDGAAYAVCDLAEPETLEIPAGVHSVIHCAAETAGSWDAHERNSLAATRNLLQASVAAGVKRFLHVSSLGILSAKAKAPIGEEAALEQDPRSRGPYVWGKLEAERIVQEEGQALGMEVRILRPGPLVDPEEGTPPGRLGRSLGPVFVAVGPWGGTIPTTDVRMAGRALARAVGNINALPPVLHLLDPTAPTRRDLVRRIRETSKGVRVVWLPWSLVRLMSVGLVGVQKVLRPGKPAIRLAAAFGAPRYSTDEVSRVLHELGLSHKGNGSG